MHVHSHRHGAAKDASEVTSSTLGAMESTLRVFRRRAVRLNRSCGLVAGRTDVLMYFRLYCFFHCLVIALAQVRRAGTASLYFYTVLIQLNTLLSWLAVTN